MWLEHIARRGSNRDAYPFPVDGSDLDFRPLLQCVIEDCLRGRDRSEIARAFHLAVAQGLCRGVSNLCETESIDTVVLSGGVFQNELLLEMAKISLAPERMSVWTNSAVPPNDGGISLGQAALASLGPPGLPMHELSIAMSILDMLEEESEKRGDVRVEAVHLKLGAMSGVVKDALVSAYQLASEQTNFESCRLVIEEVSITADCPECRAERPIRSMQFLVCGECGTPVSNIVHGRELQVTALELSE